MLGGETRGVPMIGVVEDPRREVLIFEVGGRRFGLLAAEVRELVRAVTIVPLPMAPTTVEGVINLRGRVVPVLDLRPRLGLPARAVEPSDHLIIARAGERTVALRVDRALELARPEVAGGGAAAVAKLDDGLAPIIDTANLLSPADSDALGAALDN
jgi:purine-binding chemotaxis protein CheW